MMPEPLSLQTHIDQFTQLRRRFESGFGLWPELRHELLFFDNEAARRKAFTQRFQRQLATAKTPLVPPVRSRLGRAYWEEEPWNDRLTAGSFSPAKLVKAVRAFIILADEAANLVAEVIQVYGDVLTPFDQLWPKAESVRLPVHHWLRFIYLCIEAKCPLRSSSELAVRVPDAEIHDEYCITHVSSEANAELREISRGTITADASWKNQMAAIREKCDELRELRETGKVQLEILVSGGKQIHEELARKPLDDLLRRAIRLALDQDVFSASIATIDEVISLLTSKADNTTSSQNGPGQVCPVSLDEAGYSAHVCGESVEFDGAARRRIIRVLIEAYPKKVSKNTLCKLAKSSGAVKTLGEIAKASPWKDVISMAGKKSCGYGLRWPTSH